MTHILIEDMIGGFIESHSTDTTHALRSFSTHDSYDDLKELFESIADNCREAEIREDYSGRNMYGRSCWAIVGPDPVDIIEVAARHSLTGAKFDNMGRDYVVYWPHVEFCPQD